MDAGTDAVLESLEEFPAWLDEHLLTTRLEALERDLEERGSVMVAYSGGADSAFPWTFRGVDLDLAGHINNAAYWHPLEEELLAGEEPPAIDVEIEYRAPLQPGQVEVRSDGAFRWIVGDDAVTYASIALL